MYQLLRSSSPWELFTRVLPGLLIAFVIAELFYKWHSFALECLGFLATWFVLDAIFSLISGRLLKATKEGASDGV